MDNIAEHCAAIFALVGFFHHHIGAIHNWLHNTGVVEHDQEFTKQPALIGLFNAESTGTTICQDYTVHSAFEGKHRSQFIESDRNLLTFIERIGNLHFRSPVVSCCHDSKIGELVNLFVAEEILIECRSLGHPTFSCAFGVLSPEAPPFGFVGDFREPAH
jgi:hypothetical protein